MTSAHVPHARRILASRGRVAALPWPPSARSQPASVERRAADASRRRRQSPPAARSTGTLADGATWTIIDVPADWNGTLLLYSHGLVPPGQDNPAVGRAGPVHRRCPARRRATRSPGSSYATTGCAVEDALADQLEVLDVFAGEVGEPTRTIAWGSSLGGLVTAALLERSPDRFDGGLSLCGVLAGGVGLWNTYLDSAVRAADVARPRRADRPRRHHAIRSPASTRCSAGARRRPGDAGGPGPHRPRRGGRRHPRLDRRRQPAARPRRRRQRSRPPSSSTSQTIVLFGLALRADMEARAGGNPSTNVGVDYGRLLRRSSSRREVRRRSTARPASTCATTSPRSPPRRASPPTRRAVAYVGQFAVFDGELRDPILTLHTNGDQLATVEHEQAYARDRARGPGATALLRQLFTERAGHCTFTPAETVTALGARSRRIDIGRVAGPARRRRAERPRPMALGPDLNVHFDDESRTLVPTDPAFDDTAVPPPFLRPFDLAD